MNIKGEGLLSAKNDKCSSRGPKKITKDRLSHSYHPGLSPTL